MIRAAGKAYSVFEAAKLVLASGERFRVAFSRENPGAPKFVVVTADQSVWLTRDEALAHLVSCEEVLGQFYRAEQIELEEPKGNFTNIAICGFSGQMLGPPSHHSYQTNLHKLHRERFSNMPFEDYKRRVRTEATPEAVEKWKESQKHGVQWIDLKAEVPEGGEAPRFKTRSEMETHFRTHHVESLLGESERPSVAGDVSRGNLSPQLFNAMRRSVDEARKHLLVTAQLLCAAFEKHGLKLFKRRGGKLWVSRARPRLLDHSVVLSDRIAKLVELIKSHNGIAVKDLLEIVAPAHAATETPAPVASTPETPAAGSAEPTSAPQTETAVPQENAPQAEASPERLQALKDLHWLNSEGYIVEYADGVVCIGVIEPPPAKPKATKEKTPAAVTAEAVPAAAEPAPTEAASAETAEVTGEDIPAATSEEAPTPPTVAEAEEKAPPVE